MDVSLAGFACLTHGTRLSGSLRSRRRRGIRGRTEARDDWRARHDRESAHHHVCGAEHKNKSEAIGYQGVAANSDNANFGKLGITACQDVIEHRKTGIRVGFDIEELRKSHEK